MLLNKNMESKVCTHDADYPRPGEDILQDAIETLSKIEENKQSEDSSAEECRS
jgi:hypothetical protein